MIEPIKKRVAATKASSSKDMISFAKFVDCDSRDNDMLSTPPNNFFFFNVFKRRKYFTLFKVRKPQDHPMPIAFQPYEKY